MAIFPGSRIRDNGIVGNIADNPLTASAVVMNSANLFKLSVVSGNHAIITLDPLRQFGEPEIVMVTAHSSGASAATIQRGMYGTTARSHPLNTLWVHAATNDDFELISTSGTRPSDVWRGQTLYETDTSRVMRYSGAAWVQEGLYFDPPACRLTHSVAQSVPNSTDQSLSFDTERFDTDNMHSTSSNIDRITVNTPGIYVFFGNIEWNSSGTWASSIRIASNLNGVIALDFFGGGSISRMSISTIWKAVAGEYFMLQATQFSGAPINVNKTNNWSPEFAATYIGRGN